MMVSALNFQHTGETVLVIIIEPSNLDRMKMADPITLESALRGGGVMRKVQYPNNLSLLIAYEENSAELMEHAEQGGPALLRYLERKRVWKPEVDGTDHIRTVTIK